MSRRAERLAAAGGGHRCPGDRDRVAADVEDAAAGQRGLEQATGSVAWDGEDEAAALQALVELFERRFDEDA